MGQGPGRGHRRPRCQLHQRAARAAAWARYGRRRRRCSGCRLFIKAPGQPAGAVDDRNWQHVDLLPTIAERAGVRVPWRVDGGLGGAARPYDHRQALHDLPGTASTSMGRAVSRRSGVGPVPPRCYRRCRCPSCSVRPPRGCRSRTGGPRATVVNLAAFAGRPGHRGHARPWSTAACRPPCPPAPCWRSRSTAGSARWSRRDRRRRRSPVRRTGGRRAALRDRRQPAGAVRGHRRRNRPAPARPYLSAYRAPHGRRGRESDLKSLSSRTPSR